MTAAPDYAYGRDTTAEYMTYVKHFKPDVEVVRELWPKLFQPDYTEIFTKILQTKPQVLYTCLWGGNTAKPFASQAIASPSMTHDLIGSAVIAAATSGKRRARSMPLRVRSRTRTPSRTAMIRKPSCLIS